LFPDALRRAVAVVQSRNLDHLTLFGDVEMVGFWETVLILFLDWHFTWPRPLPRLESAFAGLRRVGAFQLIKRSAYEACGTHRRLAMEVLDDMKLGKLVKQARLRSSVGVAQEAVWCAWHAGLGNLVRGVTKKFLCGLGYNLPLVVVAICAMLLMNVAPFLGVIFGLRVGAGSCWDRGGDCAGIFMSA